MDWTILNHLEKLLILNLLPYVRKLVISKTKPPLLGPNCIRVYLFGDSKRDDLCFIDHTGELQQSTFLQSSKALAKLKKEKVDFSGQTGFEVREQALIINWIHSSFSDYYYQLAVIYLFTEEYVQETSLKEVKKLVNDILHQTRNVLATIDLESDIQFTPLFAEITRLKYELRSKNVTPNFQKEIEVGLVYFQDFYNIDVYNTKVK
jgi:hypothetical protein